ELIDRMRKLPTKSQPVRDRPAYVRSAVPNVFSPVRPWDKPAARERDAERLDGAAGSQQQALTPEQQRIADEYLKRLAQDRARSERER
ncbi:MAG: hypothetical protein KDK05_12225, partial [Candidatus Competibacteraceae bacterium]|nr:hypothetical protein [Candidatus Competibacteraceae bacterium]